MNGFHPSTNFIGATGEYPIYDLIKEIDRNSSNFVLTTSNILQSFTIQTENTLQSQITDTCNLIYRDENKNTIIKITAQNPFYPLSGIPIEMLFKPLEGEAKTKIDYQGILRIYHSEMVFLPTVTSQWISVPDALIYLLQEDIQWNAQSIDNTAKFSLLDAEILNVSMTANAALMLATTAEGTAATALGEATTNSIMISIINDALPFLITSNVLFAQNYISSNTVDELYLLKTGNINLSQVNNWIKTDYGNYYDITDGTLGINATPTREDFLIVGGQTTVQGELIVEGKIKENSIYLNDVYVSSNYLINTSNTLINIINNNLTHTSNNLTITSNILIDIVNNNVSDTSNILINIINDNLLNNSNFINNTSNRLNDVINSNFVSTSNFVVDTSNIIHQFIDANFSKNIIIKIPNTNFTYDGFNSLYIYDLDIRPYVRHRLTELTTGVFVKTKVFRITSIISADFKNLENLNLNNVTNTPICFPETLTIYMSNQKQIIGSTYEIVNDDTYCNGIIYGKQNIKLNIGYWNILSNNFNYIRFLTRIGFDMLIVIEPIII